MMAFVAGVIACSIFLRIDVQRIGFNIDQHGTSAHVFDHIH